MSESSSSSIQPAQERRTCSACSSRMSSKQHDPHDICIKCRGVICNQSDRCKECVLWTDDKMALYVSHQKALDAKRKSKAKVKARKAVEPSMGTDQGAALPLVEDSSLELGLGDSASSASSMSHHKLLELFDQKLAARDEQIDQ